MEKEYKRIAPKDIKQDPFTLISKTWFLLTAATETGYNTMTCSWGALGHLWHKDICIVYVRPTRFTYEFMQKADYFTLSFLPEKHRKILQYCGSHSGRNTDKIKDTGLNPIETEKSIAFKEADLIIEAQKMAHQIISPKSFDIPEEIEPLYPEKDYHMMYTGKITNIWQKK
ncbi:flavin reductase [Spirochaetia bacterium 38H-sp]|uniref:Flavin reductase n=1 Tax=Rarispira pelagica TaxID=3141764 RepID=A0ABU9UBV7_9SPIR